MNQKPLVLVAGQPGFGLDRGYQKPYDRNGFYSLESIFSQLDFGWGIFDGSNINLGSARYKVFKKSYTCVRCGIEGIFFAKERSASRKNGVVKITTKGYHFNLYALNHHGKLVLMTKDHIVPKSLGGPDALDNYQTMCARCNAKKGNTPEPQKVPNETHSE